MKKLVIYFFSPIFLSSCGKEQIPNGLVLKNATIDVDTSYTLTIVPQAEPKRIFVEEFTGVRCQPCAPAADVLKKIQTNNAGKILVAKVHAQFQSIPVKETDPDFRCEDADNLNDFINPSSSKPKAGIDRVYDVTNSSFMYNYTAWAGLIASQLLKATPINLALEIVNYNSFSKEIKLKQTATFTKALSENLNYHIYVLENGVVATQDSIGGVEIEDYEHEEILRDIITPVGAGSPWLQGVSKPAGLEAVKISTFTLPSNVISPANCYILVALQNDATKEMIQVNEVKLQ